MACNSAYESQMFERTIHIEIKILLLSALLLMAVKFSPAQINPAPAKRFGIIPVFIKNNTKQDVNEVASNVLRVINNTDKPVNFHLRFSIPGEWQMLNQGNRNYSVAAGDSVFLPVRIVLDKKAKGNTNYIITIFLVSDKEVQFASQNWYVGIVSRPQWDANIPLKKLFFVNNSDSSGFSVHLQNSGNTDELLRLSFNADHRIEIFDAKSHAPFTQTQ